MRIWFFSLSLKSKLRVFGCLLDHVSCLKTSHRLWVIVVTFYRPQKNIDEASSASSWHQNVFPLTSSSLQGHGVNEESTHLSSDVTNTHTTIQKISSVKFSVFLRRAVFVSVRGTWCLRCCHVSSRGPTLWTLFVFAGSLWQHLLNQHVGGWRAPRTPKKKKSIWFPFQKRARCSLAASTRSERVNTRFHFALRRTESCFSVFNWSWMRNNTETWTLAAVYLLH